MSADEVTSRNINTISPHTSSSMAQIKTCQDASDPNTVDRVMFVALKIRSATRMYLWKG